MPRVARTPRVSLIQKHHGTGYSEENVNLTTDELKTYSQGSGLQVYGLKLF